MIPNEYKEKWLQDEDKAITKIKKGYALASGENLIADGSLIVMREKIHEKIIGGEMEAIGMAMACTERIPQVPFAVFRGISDYGDSDKVDDWHHIASNSAASALRAFLETTFSSSRIFCEVPKSGGKDVANIIKDRQVLSVIFPKLGTVGRAYGDNDDDHKVHLLLNFFIRNTSNNIVEIISEETKYDGLLAIPVRKEKLSGTIIQPHSSEKLDLRWEVLLPLYNSSMDLRREGYCEVVLNFEDDLGFTYKERIKLLSDRKVQRIED